MKDILFFKNKNYLASDLFPKIKIKKDFLIKGVKPLSSASSNHLTIFDTRKYLNEAIKTKSLICLTTEKLSKELPDKIEKIVVKNVLYELALILKKIYPDADIDSPDYSLKPSEKSKFNSVKFGNNVLIGKNVEIGKKTVIGSNTIIEHDVVIGSGCVIGSNVIIKNSIIGNNVVIQDDNKLGQKGFGFIPVKNKNIKFPHIGRVIVNDEVEIATACTIDRGSIDDTVIGANTYLDNQVHIAHNVKIGKNCMIAGQVGFAGSSKIGDNVSIGGQAGISGHLRIGNNVKIGGGSGVVKDIEDNQVVMGYPAVPLKEFLKNSKK